MKKVLLLGATGMLGSEVYRTLRDKYDITVTARDKSKLSLLGSTGKSLEFDAEKMMADYAVKKNEYFSEFVKQAGDVDYVINAVGVIIPFAMQNPALTFFVNSALPHILARQYGPRLIHTTTDCVYSDGKAPYNESSECSPTDIYGLSKSLGEPENCLTIRTSIVGPELSGHASLLGWFLNAAKVGTPISGYTNRMWNGITTHQFGIVYDKVMSKGEPMTGLYHVFTNPVSKYETLLAFQSRFKVNCSITPVVAQPAVDRRLSTLYSFNSWLKIPTFQKMVEEMP